MKHGLSVTEYPAEHDPATGCLLFKGFIDADGYGRISTRRAHRLAWQKAKGPIPEGLQVLHHCDRPACINVEHLFLGTNQDNVDDKLAKDRQPRGSENGRAKLTEQAVVEIRASKLPERLLARQYGISNAVVGSIRRRLTWKHIP